MIPQARRIARAIISFENLTQMLQGARMVLQGGELPEDATVIGVHSCWEETVVHRRCQIYLVSESFEVVLTGASVVNIGEVVPLYTHANPVRTPARSRGKVNLKAVGDETDH